MKAWFPRREELQVFDFLVPPVRMGSAFTAAISAFIRERFQIMVRPRPYSRSTTSDSGDVLPASALLKPLQGRFDAQFRLRSTIA